MGGLILGINTLYMLPEAVYFSR